MSKEEGIVVYCTRGNVIFSSTGEIINNNKGLRKHKLNRSIIFPEFQEMKKIETSEYWSNLLNRFSKNIPPKDFKYLNGVLYYKAKTKKHRAELIIDKEEIEISLEKFKNFLKDRGFLSPEEREEIHEIIENTREEEKLEIQSWKDILKNRDYHIRNYIISLKEEHNLNEKETINLESIIRMGISSDFFNEENIVIEKEKIKHFEKLGWDNEKRIFFIDTEGYKYNKKKVEREEKDDIWTSYTVETSNDNVVFYKIKLKNLSIDKKWIKFLNLIYKI